jgi:hypothetical protein
MMLSLREKHEYEEQIEQLNIDLIASMIECKKLNAEVLSLKAKVLHYALTSKDLAMALIQKKFNGLDIKLIQISKYSGVSYSTVANAARGFKIKHERGAK